jgi:transposase
MSKKELVGNRQYADEFKVEAVRLGESIGGNQAAKRLGIPESSLWNWIRLSRAGKLKAADAAAVPVKRSVTEVEAENARLRKELASTKLDLEIVKKAAVDSTDHCNTAWSLSAGARNPKVLRGR